MAYNLLGELVRKLRIQREMTQEELADGILSKTSLSRLESGVQVPHKDKLDAILQRLGLNSQEICNYYLNKRDYEIYTKCDTVLSLIVNDKYLEASIIVDELSLLPEFSKGIKAQLLLSYRASIMVNLNENNDEIRRFVLEALKITIPNFSEKYISSYYLSNEETTLINILSITYFNENNLDRAIGILEKLKETLDSSKIDAKQKSKLYTIVLFNLSKYYGLSKRYLEAISICDYAKEVCLNTNYMRELPGIIYNKAYCLYELGYIDQCPSLFYQAYYGYKMLEDNVRMDIVKNYARDKLSIVLD